MAKNIKKPCPFCGGNDTHLTGLQVGRNERHWVICHTCECSGPTLAKTREQAIEQWNWRANG